MAQEIDPKKITLYHGSMEKFDHFSLDKQGNNGAAQGFGIYLTPNKEMAEMYAFKKGETGYLYTTSVLLENPISLDNISVSRNDLSKILDYLQETDSILEDFNDVDYYGLENVKNEAMETLLENNKSDVEILNVLASITGDKENVAKAFYEVGKYTHVTAEEQLIQKDIVYTIFDPDRINIDQIEALADKELYYKKICEFEKSDYEGITINDSKQILYKPDIENDQKCIVYNSYFDLYEKEFKDRLLKSLNYLYLKDIKDALGEDTLKYLAENDLTIQKRYFEVSKEKDLDNDGTTDRIDIDDTRNSVQTVADLDKVRNSTNKDKEVQESKEKVKKNYDLSR